MAAEGLPIATKEEMLYKIGSLQLQGRVSPGKIQNFTEAR